VPRSGFRIGFRGPLLVQIDVPGQPFGAIGICDGIPVYVFKQETMLMFFRVAFFVIVGIRSVNVAH